MQAVVLWDLDGTLVDPADAITGGMADAIEAHGYTRPDAATLKKFVGPPASYCLAEFTDVPPQEHLAVIATYRAAYQERGIAQSSVYPGLRVLLQRLQDAGVRQGVATQKPLFMAQKVLDYFQLTPFFDVVSGSPDDLGSGDQTLPKDKPGIIERALDDLQLFCPGDRLEAVMVGDRVYDAEGARVNGLPSVGVAWGFGSQREMTEDFTCWAADVAELEAHLCRILSLDLG